MGRFGAGPGGRRGPGLVDDQERELTMEKGIFFLIGLGLGYYAVAHYRRAGKLA
jgi:hypothetical protein